MDTHAAAIEEIETFVIGELSTILGLKNSEITAQTALGTLGVDSLRFVELLIAIEKHFGLQMIDTGLGGEQLQTVHSLATHLHHHLSS